MNNKELIETVLKGIADDLVADQASKGIRASGRSARSLKPEANENEGSLKGSDYFYYQINGRRPGPVKDGIKTMLEWIKAKGITPKDPKTSLRSLAFLFMRKVSQRGNDIFQGKRPGLERDEIKMKWKKNLVDMFKENLKKEIYGAANSAKA